MRGRQSTKPRSAGRSRSRGSARSIASATPGRKSEAVELFGDQDQHRLGPVAYYTLKLPRGAKNASMKDANGDEAAGANAGEADNGDDDEATTVTAGFGVLFGLNDDTSDVALKWSLEVEF